MPSSSRGILAPAIEGGLRFYSRIALSGRGGYRLVRLARKFRTRERWVDDFRTPDGLDFHLDLSVYPDCCMAFGLYELDTARLLRKLLQPGDHFVDGGANIGYFTLLAAQRVGSGGRVDAFEPQPGNRSRLREHVARNGMGDRVRIHAEALGDTAGEAMIYVPNGATDNHGCATLFAGAAPTIHADAVRTIRMDEAIAGTSPRLIKLDIQGSEPLAISGMSGLLAVERPPSVIIEYSPPCAQAAGFSHREMLDRLLAIQPRYKVFAIGGRLTPIAPTDEALASLLHTNGEANLLLQCDA